MSMFFILTQLQSISFYSLFYLQTEDIAEVSTEEHIITDDTDREADALLSSIYFEEENKQLKYHLDWTRYELDCTRYYVSDLETRLSAVEQDRLRLIKRVTGLFSKFLLNSRNA